MVLHTELLEAVTNLSFALPPRRGAAPHTGQGLPHLQLDQWPPSELVEELAQRSLRLPLVKSKQSRMASPQSRALCLPDAFAGGPPAAFIDAHEFCHLHPPPEGSIHLTLHRDLRAQAIQLGWAEPHPVTRLGSMPETLVMVYAPRTEQELELVYRLIQGSYEFARGI